MSDVTQFHNLSHIFISLIGAVLLIAIYYNIRRRFRKKLNEGDSQNRVDKGLLHLSLALFIWVAAGIWAFLGQQYAFSDSWTYQIGVNLLSIGNSAFLLFALSYFTHAPEFISNNKKNVKLIVALIAIITLVTLGISYGLGYVNMNGIKIMAFPDLVLSAFICYLLLISLYKTFSHNNLKVVAIISVVMVFLLFISQLPEVFVALNDDFNYSLIRIIAKSSLISLFLLLATTWVINLANTPDVKEIKIKFTDWSIVHLNIPSKEIINQRIDFGSKTTQYKNLLKMAIRRKYGSGEQQGILVNSVGEIKNQSYLSRIIDNINQILNLKEEAQLERRDLFVFLGESKYRLRILPELIEIEPNLLQEFNKNPENSPYLKLCN